MYQTKTAYGCKEGYCQQSRTKSNFIMIGTNNMCYQVGAKYIGILPNKETSKNKDRDIKLWSIEHSITHAIYSYIAV